MSLFENASSLERLAQTAARTVTWQGSVEDSDDVVVSDAPETSTPTDSRVEEEGPPAIRLVPYAESETTPPSVDDLSTRLYKAGFKLGDEEGWQTKPQVRNQYTDPRFLGTWAEGPVITEVLDLHDEIQLARFNFIQAQSEPLAAPQISYESDPKIEVVGNRLTALVHYREIRYRVVQQMTDHNPTTTTPVT